jgi:hypothetical protein
VFYLHHIFRSYLPLSNPLGFSGSDMIEFAIAALLLFGTLFWDRILSAARTVSQSPTRSMLLAAALPIALRLAMLPVAGVPIPSTADDASYLLQADTLLHGRLSNPMPPLHEFFETNFVLQEPTYSSIFPLGQGIALAIGRAIFTIPWAGVLLTESLFCALMYWMLAAWLDQAGTSRAYALAGALLTALTWGPLSYWMNTYWGGAVSAIAGCLVFGALPRRNPWLLGLGLSLELLTRPYECVFLLAIAIAYLLLNKFHRAIPLTLAATLPALVLTLAHNHAVTGRARTLPYQQSRAEYGVPTTFTFQPGLPPPSRPLSQEQQSDYAAQVQVHDRESAKSFAERLFDRLPYTRYFLLPPLLLLLPAYFFFVRRDRQLWWPPAGIAIFALASNLYPYFHPHYLAAVACLFVLISVTALKSLPKQITQVMFLLAGAHFVFWYGLHLTADPQMLSALTPFESAADYVNHGDPEGRASIHARLATTSGNQLVFVHLAADHPLREWIANSADIKSEKVIWALDRGPEENVKAEAAYPGRQLWQVDPDAHPPSLTPYRRSE